MFSVRQIAALAAALPILLAASSTPASSQPAATTWVLQKGHNIPSRPPRTPQLRMEGEKLSGSTGCNSFTAKVSEKPDKRVAIEQVALTRMMCAGAQNKIEAALVRALEQTEFIEMKGAMLSFLSANRQPLLVWTRSDKAAAKPSSPHKHKARVRQTRGHHVHARKARAPYVHARLAPARPARARPRHAFATRGCFLWEARTTARTSRLF